jgi:hypothetical protein
MLMTEQGWGVHAANQPTNTKVTAAQAIEWMRGANWRGVPLSFNLMMWEEQTCSQASLDVMKALKAAVR